MIERWLQITCENQGCGETANSTMPNCTIAEFRLELGKCFERVNGQDLCRACADRAKSNSAFVKTHTHKKMRASKPKTHIAKNGRTACGRKSNDLRLSRELHNAQRFVLLKMHVREAIVEATTCAKCIQGRYSL
jgi:hypothetical protein